MKRLMRLELYTDGSCLNNLYGGWAYYLVEDSKIIAYDSGMTTHTSHQRMELYSTIEGFKKVENFFDCHKDTILVISDSAYLINCANQGWYKNWIARGWVNAQNKDVANVDLWQQLTPYFNRTNISFRRVKSHEDTYYNLLCDELAREKAEMARRIGYGYKQNV